MEAFSELIKTRRSMRQFTDELLSGDDVKLLLRAGLMAPSSKGLHSYEFVVVEDKEMLAALSQCKQMGSDFLAGAPLAIVVLADPTVSDVWIEDASVAAANILLQAEDLGLGACWIQVRNRYTADERSSEQIVKSLLGIPEDRGVVCIIAVGHKGMERKPQNEDRLKWERVHLGQFTMHNS
ncbi:MAG: nitroreductase family protein [Bacteroidaceae bacterium]|nr:nitroreductase family protein [Bacteroidaceae bacterium]